MTDRKAWGVAGCRVVDLPSHRDARGAIAFIEGRSDVPFSVERVYYLWGSAPDLRRGEHAHKALRQLYVAVAGRLTVVLRDPFGSCTVELDRPDRGLIIGPMVWRHVDRLSPDAVLLVLASEHFSEDDYYRSWDDYAAAAAQLPAPAAAAGDAEALAAERPSSCRGS